MENASKALLIAGAVLIVILLISVGIIIYNSSLGNINAATSQADAQAIMGFNARFELYEGTQTGIVIKNLLKEAIYVNSGIDNTTNPLIENVGIKTNDTQIINSFSDSEIKRGLTTRNYGVRKVKNISKVSELVNTSKKYKVQFDYNQHGAISTIHFDI